jgi:hypothetical protein
MGGGWRGVAGAGLEVGRWEIRSGVWGRGMGIGGLNGRGQGCWPMLGDSP